VVPFVDVIFMIFHQGLRDMIDLNILIFNQGPRDMIDLNLLIFHTRYEKLENLCKQKVPHILLASSFSVLLVLGSFWVQRVSPDFRARAIRE